MEERRKGEKNDCRLGFLKIKKGTLGVSLRPTSFPHVHLMHGHKGARRAPLCPTLSRDNEEGEEKRVRKRK